MKIKQEPLPLGWIVVATILLSTIVWLPLFYSWSTLGFKNFIEITSFTPHQSIFIFAIMPFAIFASIVAAAIVITKFGESASLHPIVHWISRGWPAIILVGIMLASAISLADFLFAPKSFDKFEVGPVQTIIACKEAADATKTEACSGLNEFIKVGAQKGQELISPVSYLFVQIQVIVTTAVALTLLFTCAMYIAANFIPNLSLISARPAIFFALSLFATYPILFGLWRYETVRLTGTGIDNQGYIIIFALIIVIALLIILTDKSSRSVTADLGQIAPLATLFAGFVAIKIKGYDLISPILGADANFATRFYVIVAIVLVGIIISGILLLQYQFRDELSVGTSP